MVQNVKITSTQPSSIDNMYLYKILTFGIGFPGVLTLICEGSLAWTSILYPGGKKVLKPTIRSGCPLKRFETRLITPGVSILKWKGNMIFNNHVIDFIIHVY